MFNRRLFLKVLAGVTGAVGLGVGIAESTDVVPVAEPSISRTSYGYSDWVDSVKSGETQNIVAGDLVALDSGNTYFVGQRMENATIGQALHKCNGRSGDTVIVMQSDD